MIILLIIYKVIELKFINGRPYHPQSQGSVDAFNNNIKNVQISAKDHQRGEFDLDGTVNDFFNIIT